METIEIFLIILIDALAFSIGLVLGRLFKISKQEKNRRTTVRKNSDWQALLYYTPGEPTEFSAAEYKHNRKGDLLWKKKPKSYPTR